jgi:hypothetical protein
MRFILSRAFNPTLKGGASRGRMGQYTYVTLANALAPSLSAGCPYAPSYSLSAASSKVLRKVEWKGVVEPFSVLPTPPPTEIIHVGMMTGN